MSPLHALSTAWTALRSEEGHLALARELDRGFTLGEALSRAAPALCADAVRKAAMRFEDAPVALFIVDVRDALSRALRAAATQVPDVPMAHALRRAASLVKHDTFVQHLINTMLEASGAYSEVMVVRTIQQRVCREALTELFLRSMCVLVSRADAGRRTGQRARRMEFLALPQPSAPRAS